MQQAARISDYTAFFLTGDLVEYSKTSKMFTSPADKDRRLYLRQIRLIVFPIVSYPLG